MKQDHEALLCSEEEEPEGGQRDSCQLQLHLCQLKQPSAPYFLPF